MSAVRLIPAVLFSLLLFFSQQNALLHVLQHAYNENTQQQDKQAPHPGTCEQFSHYAQFGSTVASSDYAFVFQAPVIQINPPRNNVDLPHHIPTASARGPPTSQKTA